MFVIAFSLLYGLCVSSSSGDYITLMCFEILYCVCFDIDLFVVNCLHVVDSFCFGSGQFLYLWGGHYDCLVVGMYSLCVSGHMISYLLYDWCCFM